MKILLTGFEPFGNLPANPSEQVVRKIAERARSESGHLVAEVLPTQYQAAEAKIKRLIRSVRPAAIVCLGVAASREAISLERVALNLDDEAQPDNAGSIRLGRPIAKNGPLAYQSTLPLERLRRAIQRQGIPVKISNHAGTYVCNHVFYAARHEVERLNGSAPCGLIHIPLARKPGKREKILGGAIRMTLDEMVSAVETCIRVLSRKAS